MKILAGLLLISLALQGYSAVILIDPGHGGDDTGAKTEVKVDGKGRLIQEKELTLQIAKRLRDKLSKTQTAYLTRTLDRTVTLEKRAELADTLKADLFISIHMNASTNKQVTGLETYYLDNHKDVAVRKVEEKENRNLKGGDLIVHKILTDLVISKTVAVSRPLAREIHTSLVADLSKYKFKDRGTRPGVFYVLALSKRPGILVELGFMTNDDELKRLMDEKFQDEVATSVSESIISFLKRGH